MRHVTVLICTLVLAFLSVGCSSRAEAAAQPETVPKIEEAEQSSPEISTTIQEDIQMKISITANGNTIVYGLNDSQAAKDLYAQLPLTLEVENFSTNEKVFYPPDKLSTRNTPMADAENGTLAYYAPWGDVVMFYEHFGKGSSLYELGEVISGKDLIGTLSGTIEVSAWHIQ